MAQKLLVEALRSIYLSAHPIAQRGSLSKSTTLGCPEIEMATLPAKNMTYVENHCSVSPVMEPEDFFPC
jgi:hypothetical protein